MLLQDNSLNTDTAALTLLLALVLRHDLPHASMSDTPGLYLKSYSKLFKRKTD